MKTFLTRSTPAALLGAALLLTSAATPAWSGQADGGDGEPQPAPFQVISPTLMDALEEWATEPSARYEEVALNDVSSAITEYSYAAEAAHGMPLAFHFEERYPAAYQRYIETTGQSGEESDDLIAYVMGHEQQTYAQWQQEEALTGEDVTFDGFIERYFPDVVAMAEGEPTPAAQGLTIADHLVSTEREVLMGELEVLLDGVQSASTGCGCWVALAFSNNPDPWDYVMTPIHVDDSWGFPTKRKKLDVVAAGRGAATNVDFNRLSRHHVYEAKNGINSTFSELRVRMHCTKNGQPGGEQCVAASGCSGELAMRVDYNGRVREDIDMGGPWSKGVSATAMNFSRLSYDPPGATPRQTLFEKGVGVSAKASITWDEEAIKNLIGSAISIALDTAAAGSSWATTLVGELDSDLIDNVFNLIERNGNQQQLDQSMRARFDTSGSTGLLLQPNITHTFELETESAVGGRGFGGSSESWANVDSAFSFAAVGRNYQCAVGTTAPVPGGYWSYDSAPDAAFSNPTLRNNVGDFIQVEYGVRPPASALNQIEGVYP